MKKKAFFLVVCVAVCCVFAACGKVVITLNKAEHSMEVGDTFQLTAQISGNKEFEWTSSDNDIATVSQNGLVSAKRKGIVVIAARTKDEAAFCRITITNVKGELAKAKTDAINELADLVNSKSQTHAIHWDDIKTAEATAKAAINAVSAAVQVSSELASAKAIINDFKSDTVLKAELDAAKAELLALVPTLDLYDEQEYTAKSWTDVTTAIEADISAITTATNIKELEEYIITANLANLLTKAQELENAKQTALEEIADKIAEISSTSNSFVFHLDMLQISYNQKILDALVLAEAVSAHAEAMNILNNFDLFSAYVTSAAEFVNAIQSNDITFIYVKEGVYDLTNRTICLYASLNTKKIIMGAGESATAIYTSTDVAGEASITFYNSVYLSGISFVGSGTDEISGGKPVIKVGMIVDLTQDKDRRLAEFATFDGITVTTVEGTNARGINLHGIKNATLLNSTIEMDKSKGGTAISAAWIDLEISNCNIGNGTWGSIGIMFESHNMDYQGDVKVSIDQTSDISSHIYAESFEEYNVSVEGLDWESVLIDTGTKVYLNPKLVF